MEFDQVTVTVRAAVSREGFERAGGDMAQVLAQRAAEAVKDGCVVQAVGVSHEVRPIPVPRSSENRVGYARAYVQSGVGS